MRFAFSNIAWSPHDDPAVLELLRAHGIRGIEVAPTKVWPGWEGATVGAARAYRAWLADRGFEVPALQAILYDRPQARLFDAQGERALERHVARVAEIAGALGAPVMVLGAPRQRDAGTLDFHAALERVLPLLRRLADTCAAAGTCLCVEPNPRAYGCSFVVNAREALELVRHVDRPGCGLHLDAAALWLEGEALVDVWPAAQVELRHFHVSEPELGDFAAPRVPHRTNLDWLARRGYEGWCSVEMREPARPLAEVGPWQLLSPAQTT